MKVGRKRRLAYLLAAGALGMLIYAAAPALSQRPYLPTAVDFEQPLGPVARVAPPGAAKARAGHGKEPRVTFRSGVIEAPQRFDLAGLAGERRELELRARESGGEWSEWLETANGDPVIFDGAVELQLRTRGWRPSGTLHYVNVSGTSSASETLLTRFRQAVNSAFVSVSSIVDAKATAIPTQPQIVSRAAWGANREVGGCRPRSSPAYGRVKSAVVHHTVSASDYSPAEAPAIVLGICRYHRNGNDWNDVGYNVLVDRFGTLYQGRAGGRKKAVVGAHSQGFNAQTTSISSIGTHTTIPLSPQAKHSLIVISDAITR